MVKNLRKNRDGDRIGADRLGERLVDFDRVHRKIVEISEARIAGAEIVDVNVVPFFAEAKNGLLRYLLPRRVALGNLNAQAARRNAGFGKRVLQHGQEFRIGEIGGRNVHVDAEAGTFAQSLPKITQDVPHHQPRDLSNKAALLGNLDEVIRADGYVVLVGPTGQGFHLDDLFVLKIDNWLIDDAERIFPNCAQQLALKTLLAAIDDRANKSRAVSPSIRPDATNPPTSMRLFSIAWEMGM